jgi:transposase
MICAGIDTGKRKLDMALEGRPDQLQVDNTPTGHKDVSSWLRRHRVKRVGIEASGGFHWNDQLKVLYKRLIAAGKPHKVALIACARKLLIYANTVVERGTPWLANPAAA